MFLSRVFGWEYAAAWFSLIICSRLGTNTQRLTLTAATELFRFSPVKSSTLICVLRCSLFCGRMPYSFIEADLHPLPRTRRSGCQIITL